MQRPPRDPPPGCPKDAIVLTFPVAPEFAGMRLDRFIQRRIPRLSRTRANEIVKASAYYEDGRRRRPSQRVRAGEVVILVRSSFEEPETPDDFEILCEDAAVLVVDKPSGLPVHPSATYHRNTLTYLLGQRYPEQTPHLAHRLDRETSGVLMCAKTVSDERLLKGEFENRRVHKVYLAIVDGLVVADEDDINLPMGRPEHGLHLLMEVQANGNPAQTRFQTLARAEAHTLLALWPKTGRQHQLRVHCAAIGHPIVGDKLYGPGGPDLFFEFINDGMHEDLESRLGHTRQALHAHKLRIRHPRRDEYVDYTSPLPTDLRELWLRLGGDEDAFDIKVDAIQG